MRVEADGSSKSKSLSPPRATNGSSPSSLRKAALSNVLNGSSNGHSDSNDLPQQSHTNGNTSIDGESLPPVYYGHDREEVARILIQGLDDLGYHTAATALSAESGYELETKYASAFRGAVLQGDWAEAETLLCGRLSPVSQPGVSTDQQNGHDHSNGHDADSSSTNASGLELSPEASQSEMLFLIRQQKYLEFLEARDFTAALTVLRQELQPLHQDERQLHALSSLMMCQSSDDVKSQAGWDGAQGDSRRILLSTLSRSISPSVMIPEHRLADLFNQVKQTQILNCVYHNTSKRPSLYMDHLCAREDFPLRNLTQLEHHSNEVWFVQFSNDGKRLATASKDRTVRIYDLKTFQVLHSLDDHEQSVAYAVWSPDDSRIVTCSQDWKARLWDTSTGRCLRSIAAFESPVTAAAWAPDGKSFAVGTLDIKKPLSIWPLNLSSPDFSSSDPKPLHIFDVGCYRVQDCAVAASQPSAFDPMNFDINTRNPPSLSSSQPPLVRLVASCVDKSVHVFDYHRREKLSQISMQHDMTCLSLSRDGEEMLMNLGCGEVWAMEVDSKEVRKRFRGQKQGNYVIRSCFGGASEGFVVSGGEDGKICIWHRHSGQLIEQLDAHHASCINAVAWNAANPDMFASVGDDKRVYLWSKPTASCSTSNLSPSALRDILSHPQPSAASSSTDPPAQSEPLPRWGSGSGAGRGSALMSLLSSSSSRRG